MTSAHALTMAMVGPNSLLYSSWWVPRGSFGGFIALSGFTIAVVFSWDRDQGETQHRLFRRAWQVFVVMFVSNVVLLIAKLLLTHELDKLRNLTWWLGLVTLRTEYSISGVLLPTVVLLLFAPLLFRAAQHWKPIHLTAVAFLFALFARTIPEAFPNTISAYRVTDILFGHGLGGFPVLIFFSSGVLGFVLGLLWKRSHTRLSILSASAVALAFFSLKMVASNTFTPAAMSLIHESTLLSRFLLVLVIGALLTKSVSLTKGFDFFGLVGKYTLFSFITHRLVIQTLAVFGRHYLNTASAELLYLLYLFGTFALIVMMCAARERFAPLDTYLKRVYL
jgi:hypothetical protein